MFSVRQKREIAEAVERILRDTNHPELPEGRIKFILHVCGKERWSFADIKDNGLYEKEIPSINERRIGSMMQEFEKYEGIPDKLPEDFIEDIENVTRKPDDIEKEKEHG